MNVRELQDIIKKYGDRNYDISGRKLLEHIEDVDGFVSLLSRFTRWSIVRHMVTNFAGDYPNIIEFILNNDTTFVVVDFSVYVHVDDLYYGVDGDDR
jgi:hypothetical protein